MNLGRQLVVYAGIFVLGVALYVLTVFTGTAFGLSSDVARLLAFGGLIAYFLAIVIVVQRRRRETERTRL
jgi:hypothetical protein